MTLEAFTRSLRRLLPDASHDFICPICHAGSSLGDPKGPTEAHIIPKAAGGRETTFICKECNSRAGHSLDAWFGDVLQLTDRGQSIFGTHRKHQGMTINDVPVGGTIGKDGDTIRVMIHAAHTNPAALERIQEQARSTGIKTMTVKFPLLGKEWETDLAVLQAGYLLLVRIFGWVPVFQKSLDIVRKQLLDYDVRYIDHKFVGVASHNAGYTFGLAQVDGRICLYAAFGRLVVFLPPTGDERFYSELPRDYKTASIWVCRFKSQHRASDTSCALVLDRKVLLWPDALALSRAAIFQVAHLAAIDAQPRFTHPASVEEMMMPRSEGSIQIQVPFPQPSTGADSA